MANIITGPMPAEHERLLKAAYENLITFGKLFLAGDFNKSETPFFHYEIAELPKHFMPWHFFVLWRGVSSNKLLRGQ